MAARTFVEKIFDAPAGSIVFRKPDIVLTHDNSASIYKTFKQMGGETIAYPDRLLIVLDHNAPPTDARLANQYQSVRNIVKQYGIKNFYDAGKGICHQIVSYHALPGMIITGSDSHTCTAGAFNALAAGIDRTEAAGLWVKGETWFRVPDSIRINLSGSLAEGVAAKDLSLYIIGLIGSDGANYMSIEYHGEGVASLGISERMTLANLASEMGAKNAVFPPDKVLSDYYNGNMPPGVWADKEARYHSVIDINMSDIPPLVAAPHHVDNVKSVSEVEGLDIHQGLIGTCTNGRIEDLREAAAVLKGKTVKSGVQLLVIPASQKIFLQAMEEGLVKIFIEAGANVLSPSCGPCLGTGQGIPADGMRVISTANRNFLGRMGNKEAEIYLASPETVAHSVINGYISDPRGAGHKDHILFNRRQSDFKMRGDAGSRKSGQVWDYSDIDNLNTDQMFAGNLTYNIMSSDPEAIMPHLFAGFDPEFAGGVTSGDIIIAGDNFGCGSSREHPAVGLAHAGVKAVIVKSVNRIFFRSSINQGLLLIVAPEAVEAYRRGINTEVDPSEGVIRIGEKTFRFEPLPGKLQEIIEKRGLVNWIRSV